MLDYEAEITLNTVEGSETDPEPITTRSTTTTTTTTPTPTTTTTTTPTPTTTTTTTPIPTTTTTTTTTPPPTTQCENCISTTNVLFDKCEPIKDQPITVALDGEGKWLRIQLTVTGVCKSRDVVAGIFLSELVNGVEKAIAFKAISLPKIDPTSDTCDTRKCDCARFAILPNAPSCEGIRRFKVRVFAHHLLDSDETIAPCKACENV